MVCASVYVSVCVSVGGCAIISYIYIIICKQNTKNEKSYKSHLTYYPLPDEPRISHDNKRKYNKNHKLIIDIIKK